MMALADADATGEVVHPQRRVEGLGDGLPAVEGDEERQRLHQMGRVAEQSLALVERFVHEAVVALVQVAQTAVHHLRGLRRRARREVLSFDERRVQPSRRGIEGDARAGDASSDDEHVEAFVGQAAEGGVTREPHL